MITRKDIFFLPAVIGSILLALLCLTHGIRLIHEVPIVAGTLLATTFVWTAVAGAFLFRTRSRVAHMGLGGLAFYVAVGILALSASFMSLAFAENAEFFRAFALEGVALTLGVLGVAWFAPLWRDVTTDSE